MKIPHWVKNCVMKLNEPTAWYSVRKGYNSKFKWPAAAPTELDKNELRQYADDHKEGPGLWKFDNYFEIYDRHFRRFREKDVHVLEIGVYSGGSLDMWRSYFGPKAKIYGVDREPACTMYEGNNVKIFIGNQRDRNFWKRFREQVPNLDVVIDDAGQSWLGKSGQRDKWSFCLIAAMMTANRRDNEQATAPEPHTGIQVEGGSGRHQGR